MRLTRANAFADVGRDEVLFVKNGAFVALLARGNVPIDHLVNLANSLDLSHRYVAPE